MKPQISEGGVVRLAIYQELSSIQNTLTAAQGGIITNKRSFESTVLVDDGNIVVLGGLIEDRTDNSRSSLPILGRIPGLGYLFSYENRGRKKTNLLVFLRPYVVRDESTSSALALDRYAYIRGQVATNSKPDNVIFKGFQSTQLPEAPPVPPAMRQKAPETTPGGLFHPPRRWTRPDWRPRHETGAGHRSPPPRPHRSRLPAPVSTAEPRIATPVEPTATASDFAASGRGTARAAPPLLLRPRQPPWRRHPVQRTSPRRQRRRRPRASHRSGGQPRCSRRRRSRQWKLRRAATVRRTRPVETARAQRAICDCRRAARPFQPRPLPERRSRAPNLRQARRPQPHRSARQQNRRLRGRPPCYRHSDQSGRDRHAEHDRARAIDIDRGCWHQAPAASAAPPTGSLNASPGAAATSGSNLVQVAAVSQISRGPRTAAAVARGRFRRVLGKRQDQVGRVVRVRVSVDTATQSMADTIARLKAMGFDPIVVAP